MHEALLTLIRKDSPIATATLMQDLRAMRANGCNMEGLPLTASEMSQQVLQLAVAGHVEIRGGVIEAVYQEPKAKGPEQKALF
jgi:hypothetical protein